MSQQNNIYASGTTTSNQDFSTILKFAMNSMMMNVNTCYPAEIISANQATNRYSVRSIVNSLNTTGQPLNSPTVYNIPSVIISGGSAGVIIDLQVGDIVLVCCFQRDSTSSINNQSTQKPNTNRKFSIADSVIIGKIPNSLPTTYVHIKANGDVEVHGTNVVTNCTTSTVNATTANLSATHVNLGSGATQSVLMQGIPMTADISGVATGGGASNVTITVKAGGSATTKTAV